MYESFGHYPRISVSKSNRTGYMIFLREIVGRIKWNGSLPFSMACCTKRLPKSEFCSLLITELLFKQFYHSVFDKLQNANEQEFG